MRLRPKGGLASTGSIDIIEILLIGAEDWTAAENSLIEAALEMHSHPAILVNWRKERAEWKEKKAAAERKL
jgi:hypothetical protein